MVRRINYPKEYYLMIKCEHTYCISKKSYFTVLHNSSSTQSTIAFRFSCFDSDCKYYECEMQQKQLK